MFPPFHEATPRPRGDGCAVGADAEALSRRCGKAPVLAGARAAPFLTRLAAVSSLSFAIPRVSRGKPTARLAEPQGAAGIGRDGARARRRKIMAFEFGMFHEFQRTAEMTDEDAFAVSFEQVDAAERWGLDAMWLAEIHVAPERSVCSAPLTLASAIAARTKRMKIGTGVQVLPLCHPLRLAEEAATVDQISHGRLIFGVGRSGFPRTYEAYGVPYGESRERFAETLEILKKAWTEDPFSYSGKFYKFDNVRLTPKPYQKPWPEIRIAANSPDTFPAIGTLGHGVFVAVRLGTLSELAPNIRAYREAYKAAGHPGEGQVFLRAPVYLAETAEQARSVPVECIMNFYRYLGERLESP